ncbi:MAG: helix-turn-helix domain-containing protein [Lachnospiraceae bacterium]|nr:helix-turn-helix domain-containing protein [Lachnospiraceae bacterium]
MVTIQQAYHISKAQISCLRHYKGMATCMVDRLCNLLKCDISDIMEHRADDNLF